MSHWHDNLLAYRMGYEFARIRAKQEHTHATVERTYTKLEEAISLIRDLRTAQPAKSTWSWAIEFGRMAGKAVIPQLAPYVWALVVGLGSAASAATWATWRILRSYLMARGYPGS